MTTKTATKELPIMHDLTKLEGWESLENAEQQTIKQETKELDSALLSAGAAKLSVGEHLYNVREVLKPKRMFEKYLKTITGFSRATANRYIGTYLAAKDILPAPVMKVAMLRGMDSINLKLAKANPLPKNANVVVINEYLDSLERGSPRQENGTDPESTKKESYNFVRVRFHRVPNRAKAAWMRSLISILFGEMGVSGPQSVEPSAVPEGYRSTRGRPRNVVKAA